MPPLTGLEFLLELVFYKDVAPLALGFSSGKFLAGDSAETPDRVRQVYRANESACSRMEQNFVRV
jgi:hypothetical protein